MAAMAVAEAAHMHAPFHSPDDRPGALHRGHADLEEERMTTGAEERPAVPGDDEQGGNHYTSQESASSQGVDHVTPEATAGQTAGGARQTTDNNRTGRAGEASKENATDADHANRTKLCDGETVDESHQTLRDEYVDRVWEEFVTHFLLGSCHIQKAAIFDLVTRRPLAASGNLSVSAAEMEQLVASLHHTQLAYRNGVTIGGKAYKVRLADGRNGILARTESEGCTVCKTHTLIIIGVHDKRGSSRKCNEDVMRLGDFFRKKAV